MSRGWSGSSSVLSPEASPAFLPSAPPARAPSLSYRLRRELIEQTCRFVRGRIPVLVGITDTSLVESATLARHAAGCGAAAVVTSAPFYFPRGNRNCASISSSSFPKLPLPLMLYNMPALTKTSFSGEVVSWALDQEAIVGPEGQLGRPRLLPPHAPAGGEGAADWSFLVGPEELLAESVLLGGHGGINGGANLHPSLYVSLYEAGQGG